MSKIFSAIKSRAPQGPGGPHAMGESHSFWSARPKDDPREIYNWKIYVVTCVSCMGGFLYGYDSGVMGGMLSLDSFKQSFNLLHLNATDLANKNADIVSMLQAGAFFGSLLVGPFADRYGRKIGLIIGCSIFMVGSVMQVVSIHRIGLMMGGRCIGGFGVGACSTLAPLYTSENVPKAIRGRLTACYQLFIQIGLMISFWINYGVDLHVAVKPAQWQIPLALQMLPGLILILGMMPLNESPRHLIRIGRDTAALQSLSWIRDLPQDHVYVQAEFTEMGDQLENENLLVGGGSHWTLWKEAFTIKSNRDRLIMGLTLMMLQQLMGVNAINYYSPQIFKNLGLSSTTTTLFATGIYGVVKVCASLSFALFFADGLGRRRSLLWTGTEQACCLFYVGAFVRIKHPQPGEAVPPAGIVALVCIYLYIVGFEMGWGPVPWIYNAEIHTNRLRGLCLGAAAATNWLFNFVVSRATPVMLTSMGQGGYGAFLFYASFCVICVIYAYFFCPETRGMSLEQMDSYFGTPRVVDPEKARDHDVAQGEDGDTKQEGEEHAEGSPATVLV